MADATQTEMVEVTVWVLVDEDGNYLAHEDRDLLSERYTDEIGVDELTARRVVKVTVNVPKPKPVELVATVAEEPDAAELKLA